MCIQNNLFKNVQFRRVGWALFREQGQHPDPTEGPALPGEGAGCEVRLPSHRGCPCGRCTVRTGGLARWSAGASVSMTGS